MALDDLTPRLPAQATLPDDDVDDLPGPGVTPAAIDTAAQQLAGLPPLDDTRLHTAALVLSADAAARRQLRAALPPSARLLAAGPALAVLLLSADRLGDLLTPALPFLGA